MKLLNEVYYSYQRHYGKASHLIQFMEDGPNTIQVNHIYAKNGKTVSAQLEHISRAKWSEVYDYWTKHARIYDGKIYND